MCTTSQIYCLKSSEFLDDHTYSVINGYLAVFDTHTDTLFIVLGISRHI